MVRELWCAGIDSAARRAVTVLGDCQSGTRLFLCERDVLDLLSTKDGDRRRQAVAENLALIVADDDDCFRRSFLEFFSQFSERVLTTFVTFAPNIQRRLVCESRSPLPD